MRALEVSPFDGNYAVPINIYSLTAYTDCQTCRTW